MYKIISSGSGCQESMDLVAEQINKDNGHIVHAYANKFYNIFVYEIPDHGDRNV